MTDNRHDVLVAKTVGGVLFPMFLNILLWHGGLPAVRLFRESANFRDTAVEADLTGASTVA